MLRYWLFTHAVCMGFLANGQIAEFTFTGASGTPSTVAPDAQPENGTLTDISRGSGINAASASGTFSANGWPLSSESFDATAYFTFTIQAETGFELSLTSIMLEERRSSTGIRDWSIRSSLDGFVNDLASFNVPDDANTRTQTINLTSDFSNVPSSTPIEFRIYGFNAESGSGSWRLDDIQFFGTIAPPDIEAPLISSSEATTETTALVTFNEAVDLISSQSTTNYLLNGTTNPTASVRQTAINQVLLTFSSSFQDGETNTLAISNVTDLIGNAITTLNTEFVFTLISPAQIGDIIINEIMADPTPVVDLPDAEYVELFNQSSRNINLQSFTLTGDEITDSEFVLKSGEYVVLTDDSNTGLFSGNVIELSSMGALTNSGETVRLVDEINSLTIDTVSYQGDWYRDDDREDGGFSLERIGPITACGTSFSWRASQDVGGGTPGEINSVNGQDLGIPDLMLTEFQSIASNTLQLEFTPDLLANSLSQAIIEIDELSIETINPNEGSTFQIRFNEDFEIGTIYELRIDSLMNCDGNFFNDFTVTFGEGTTPGYNELLITEIMANPVEDSPLPEAEYLELFNPTNSTLSLEGISLSDASSETNLSETLLAPGEYLILTPNSDVQSLSAFGQILGVSNWPSLNNTGDIITLSKGDTIIFSVNYSIDWYRLSEEAEGGISLEMIDVNNPCGRMENWAGSLDSTGGTPGSPNSIATDNPDNLGPELTSVFADSSSVEINFSEKLNPSTSSQLSISFEPTLEFSERLLTRPNDDQILVSLSEELETGITYLVQIDNIPDCLNNLSDLSSSFNLPEEAIENDIVLNELLFNPRTGGVDFIEVLNRSDKYINLKNWTLSSREADSLVNIKVISESNLVVAPGDFLVFTEDPITLKADYPSSDEATFITVDIPSLPNEEGSIVVQNKAQVIIDEFAYSEDFHLTLLDDVEGVSLERVSSESITQSENNWRSAASTVGFATPGLPNSQSVLLSNPVNSITIDPKVITPDNDGQSDFATINYSFNGTSNLVTVTIFDAFGREVRKLLDNATVPPEGFVTWDGTSNSGSKVRIGPYIVLFEIFDADGVLRNFKENMVVGGRL